MSSPRHLAASVATAETLDDKQLLETSGADQKIKKGTGHVFTAVLFAFVVVFLLIILAVGVRIYSSVEATRTSNDEARLGLALIVNSVRINDAVGSVGAGMGPEGQSLVLTEVIDSGSYETRIYAYKGSIVQEYAIAENAYTPEKSREVVKSNTFSFTYSDGLLTIHTDQGSSQVTLRSAGGSI